MKHSRKAKTTNPSSDFGLDNGLIREDALVAPGLDQDGKRPV